MNIDDNELSTHVVDLIARFDKTFLELASLLRQLQDKNHDQFKSLMKLPKLGQRKAYCLVEIERTFANLPADEDRLISIGWTKLYLISRYVSESNYDQLLTLAEKNKALDLRKILRSGVSAPKLRPILLAFTPWQYKLFEKQLLKHGAQKRGRGLGGKEKALIKALSETK